MWTNCKQTIFFLIYDSPKQRHTWVKANSKDDNSPNLSFIIIFLDKWITKRLPQKPSNIHNMQTFTVFIYIWYAENGYDSFSLLITHNEELHRVRIIIT